MSTKSLSESLLLPGMPSSKPLESTTATTIATDPPPPPSSSSSSLAHSSLSSPSYSSTTNNTTATSNIPSSRLSSMFAKYQKSLQKIDALEHRLEEKVTEKRQRAFNLLDEMSNVRHASLRIFVTHEHEEEGEEYDDNEEEEEEDVNEKIGENGKEGKGGDGNKQKEKDQQQQQETMERKKECDEDGDKKAKDHSKTEQGVKMSVKSEGQEKEKNQTNNDIKNGMNANSTAADTITIKDINATKVEDSNATTNSTKEKDSKNDNMTSTSTSKPKNPTTKWKLLIEGKQLVPQIDHYAAQQMDKLQSQKASEQNRLYATQMTSTIDQGRVQEMTNKERIANRFLHDREGEDVLQPLLFTYFWDRISVSFQPFQRQIMTAIKTSQNMQKDEEQLRSQFQPSGPATNIIWNRMSANSFSVSTSNKNNTSNNKISIDGHHDTINKSTNKNSSENTNTTGTSTANNAPKTASSIRSIPINNNADSHAFHVVYEQEHDTAKKSLQEEGDQQHSSDDENSTVMEHMVVATIRLHRRANYNASSLSGTGTGASGGNSSITGSSNTTSTSVAATNTSGGGTSASAAFGGASSNTGNQNSLTPGGANYNEQKYKLSKILLTTLFPRFLPKKKTTTSNYNTISSDTKNSSSTSQPNNNMQKSSSSTISPPIDNEIHIPKVFTMDEILTAFYIYIADNKLQERPKNLSSIHNENDNESTTRSTSLSAPASTPATMATTPLETETGPSSSTVYNDAKLQAIFKKPTMRLYEIQNLLLSKNLIIPTIFGVSDAPIVLTYIMKKENACRHQIYEYEDEREKKRKRKRKKEKKVDSNNNGDDNNKNQTNGNSIDCEDKKGKNENNEMEKGEEKNSKLNKDEGKRKRINEEITEDIQPPSNKRKRVVGGGGSGRSDGKIEGQMSFKTTQENQIIEPNLLSCDVDVDVPHLYHSRTRDILRRIKIREHEYASCRTRALRFVQQTRINENDAKMLLENVIAGKALTKEHIPMSLALAKAAQEGGEVRVGSHIDVRLSMLMERLEHHTKNAQACWDLVDACRSGTSHM